jgi:hypothetical protein
MKPFNPGFSQFNAAPKPFASNFGGQGAPRPFASPYSQALQSPPRNPSLFGGYGNMQPKPPGFAERLGAFGDAMGGNDEPVQHNPVQPMQLMQAPQLNPMQGPGGNIQALLQSLYMQGRR